MSPDPRGRQVYTRGPVIRMLEAVNVLTAIAAIVALVVSLSVFSSRVDTLVQRQQDIQSSRVQSATDTCRTLRAVIEQAYAPASKRITYHAVLIAGGHRRRVQIQFAPVAKGLAAKVVKADGLTDCLAHARKLTRLPAGR